MFLLLIVESLKPVIRVATNGVTITPRLMRNGQFLKKKVIVVGYIHTSINLRTYTHPKKMATHFGYFLSFKKKGSGPKLFGSDVDFFTVYTNRSVCTVPSSVDC
jgi:hypothetical protein